MLGKTPVQIGCPADVGSIAVFAPTTENVNEAFHGINFAERSLSLSVRLRDGILKSEGPFRRNIGNLQHSEDCTHQVRTGADLSNSFPAALAIALFAKNCGFISPENRTGRMKTEVAKVFLGEESMVDKFARLPARSY